MFDTGMTMSAQVASVLKSVNYHLVNIGRAPTANWSYHKMAIHSLVISRLDYCNSLIVGRDKPEFAEKTSECPTYISQTARTQVLFHHCRTHQWTSLASHHAHQTTHWLQNSCSCVQSPSWTSSTWCRRCASVTFGDRAFSTYAPRLWNSLSGHIKDSTFEQFKNSWRATFSPYQQ